MTLETELQRLYNFCEEDAETAKVNRDRYRAEGDEINAAYFDGVKNYSEFILSVVMGDFRGETGRNVTRRNLTAEEQKPTFPI